MKTKLKVEKKNQIPTQQCGIRYWIISKRGYLLFQAARKPATSDQIFIDNFNIKAYEKS